MFIGGGISIMNSVSSCDEMVASKSASVAETAIFSTFHSASLSTTRAALSAGSSGPDAPYDAFTCSSVMPPSSISLIMPPSSSNCITGRARTAMPMRGVAGSTSAVAVVASSITERHCMAVRATESARSAANR